MYDAINGHWLSIGAGSWLRKAGAGSWLRKAGAGSWLRKAGAGSWLRKAGAVRCKDCGLLCPSYHLLQVPPDWSGEFICQSVGYCKHLYAGLNPRIIITMYNVIFELSSKTGFLLPVHELYLYSSQDNDHIGHTFSHTLRPWPYWSCLQLK